MPNPNTFEEASAATEEMFTNDQISLDDAVSAAEAAPPADSGEPAASEQAATDENAPQQQTANQPAAVIEKAAQTAEVAAQLAAEKDSQLKQANEQIEALTQQNLQLQGTIDEMSKQNTEEIIEDALTPPVLDISGLAFADEETQRAAMAKFTEDMSAYNRKQIMKELSPTLEYAKKGMMEDEARAALSTLSQIPELKGIEAMRPQLDRIIANNKWLSSEDMPLDEKYINAYAMARGIDIINNPENQPGTAKEQTPEEMLALYNSNPAFRELVEKQRIEALKPSQQVPPFSASSGAVNAALDIKEKPKTFEEASERTRKMSGGV
ncbi:MAG: hypothetical protein IKK94_05540 [Clostridia bacterium]|nr:hypothetical protein [Clostridia bacterium]